jgi:hypothetical protein
MRTSLTTNIEHYTPLRTDALLINSGMAKRKSTFTAFGPTKRPVLPPGTVELHKIDPDGDLLLKFSRFSDVESQADEAVADAEEIPGCSTCLHQPLLWHPSSM